MNDVVDNALRKALFEGYASELHRMLLRGETGNEKSKDQQVMGSNLRTRRPTTVGGREEKAIHGCASVRRL
jgi:hypothetical protein